MGKLTRQPLTVCDIDSIEFMNELFFVESEIMDLYKQQLKTDPRDDTYSHFSEEEQIERYAKNYLFWWNLYNEEISKQQSSLNQDTPRLYYITTKRIDFLTRMNNVFEDRPHVIERIQKRSTELSEIERENNDIKHFINSHPYPSYDEVRKLINRNVAMCAEYGTLNHKWMEKIYNDIFDRKKIKVIGKLINVRGGMTAMVENFSTFMTVVRHLLKRVVNKTNDEKNIIQYNIYNEVNTAWDRIDLWRK